MAVDRRVMIVDDDIDFADSLQDILETEDYFTKTASNPGDALLNAKAFDPYVALLDVRLGQANGLDLLTTLKQEYPHLLCITMTAYANVETAIRALQYGAYDYLRKPVHPEELTAILRRAFEKIELEQRSQLAVLALQESEERYRSIFENALEGIFRCKLNGEFLDVNPALVQMLGYNSRDEVLALDLERDVYSNREDYQYVLDQLQARKAIKNFEVSWKRKPGKRITVSLNSKVVSGADQGALLCEGLVQDITERKQSEGEIRRRNRELDLLNRVIAATATASDTETILDTVCHELALVFDVPQVTATLLNQEKPIVTFVADYHEKEKPDILNKSVPAENNPVVQYMRANKNPLVIENAQQDPRLAFFKDLMQERGTVSILILPLIIDERVVGSLNIGTTETRSFSDEEISLAQSVAEQVTGALIRVRLDEQHRQLEDQLRQSHKMEAIGRLAGGIAHDFNNLLTVITGYSELLLNHQMDKNDPEYKAAELIREASERASTLTRQLLAFSRQQVIQPTVLDLNAVIADLNKMLSRLVSEAIDLKTDLAPSLGYIKADSGQVEQVIMNLVINAVDAMPKGGELTLQTAKVDVDRDYANKHVGLKPGPYVVLTVLDTGEGMDAEIQSRIFEPFFTTKEKDKGTGLGLATVYGIVQQNSGYISVSSQPEQGTTFQIYFPRLDQEPVSRYQGQTSLNAQQGTETILLVEDEEIVRGLASRALRRNGYRILEAANGQEAIKVFEQYDNEPIHLLLTDVVMPGGLNGQELANLLTARQPGLKVLLMSGHVDHDIAETGLLESGVPFLQKPFSPIALSLKIRELLDN